MTFAQDRPEIEVRQDPETKEYIFKEQAFTDLWAWMLFLEARVDDLETEVAEERDAVRKAVDVSERIIKHNADLIERVGDLEVKNLDLVVQNTKLKNRPTQFELVMMTASGIVLGIGTGFLMSRFIE